MYSIKWQKFDKCFLFSKQSSFRFYSGSVFPYEVSDYNSIKKGKQFLVDKSMFIPELEQIGKHTILQRPKHWGKSLLQSMLHQYYDINEEKSFNELFGDLEISKNPTKGKNNYLVLPLKLSNIKFEEENSFHDIINKNVINFIEKYNITLDLDPMNSFVNLKKLGEKVKLKGEKLMILIDDYDYIDNTILINKLQNVPNHLTNETFIYSLYETIKAIDLNNSNFRTFSVGTMPLKLSDMNLFQNISFNNQFGNLLGFTQKDIEIALDSLNIFNEDRNFIIELMNRYYSGYLFFGSSEYLYHPNFCLYLLNKINEDKNILQTMIPLLKSNKLNDLLLLNQKLNDIHVGAMEINLFDSFFKSHSQEIISNLLNSNEKLLINEKTCFNIEPGIEISKFRTFILHFLYYNGFITLQNANNVDLQNKLDVIVPNQLCRDFFIERSEIKNVETSNDSLDLFNIALSYFHGYEVEKDIHKAKKYFKLAADKNHVQSQFNLGLIFQNEGDLQQAFTYYKLAADQNDINAQCNLGNCFLSGNGVEKDLQQAFKYTKLAADKNLPTAQFNLAVMYHNGDGIERNLQQSFKYYKLAADNNHLTAQFNLGLMYLEGDGVEKNLKQALNYFKLAADKNHPIAQFNTGILYFQIESNVQQSLLYFKLAIDKLHLNDLKVLISIGDMLLDGRNVEKDTHSAFEFYKLAADYGSIDGQWVVGNAYKNGYGVEKNSQLAFKYIKFVADKNVHYAQYVTGMMYRSGEGVEKNDDLAFSYFKSSADNNNAGGQYMMGMYYQAGNRVEKNVHTAFNYFKLAADEYDDRALFQVGNCYYDGEGVERDLEQAYKYYTLAAEQDHSGAKYKLATKKF